MGTFTFQSQAEGTQRNCSGTEVLWARGSKGETESGLKKRVRWVKEDKCMLACTRDWTCSIFQRLRGILILSRLRKLGGCLWERGSWIIWGGGSSDGGDGHSSGWSRSLFPVSSEESSLKELMKWKQWREGDAGLDGGYRSIYGGASHYSVILLKMPLKDSPREVGRKESEWNVTTEKCHWWWSVWSGLMWRDISPEWQVYSLADMLRLHLSPLLLYSSHPLFSNRPSSHNHNAFLRLSSKILMLKLFLSKTWNVMDMVHRWSETDQHSFFSNGDSCTESKGASSPSDEL